MIDKARRKLERLHAEVLRPDLSGPARLINLVEKGLQATPWWPQLHVGREYFYELRSAPREFRGLGDLSVRRGGLNDVAGLCSVDGAEPKLVEARFARGDLAFLGEHEGCMLAHVWFQRGPSLFCEDEPDYPAWQIPSGGFWSYHAAARSEARASGVFVKVFQIGLRTLFMEEGAAVVQCRVKSTYPASVTMHERMGFRRLGALVAVSIPGVRWLSWTGDAGPYRRLGRRRPGAVMTLPPSAA